MLPGFRTQASGQWVAGWKVLQFHLAASLSIQCTHQPTNQSVKYNDSWRLTVGTVKHVKLYTIGLCLNLSSICSRPLLPIPRQAPAFATLFRPHGFFRGFWRVAAGQTAQKSLERPRGVGRLIQIERNVSWGENVSKHSYVYIYICI